MIGSPGFADERTPGEVFVAPVVDGKVSRAAAIKLIGTTGSPTRKSDRFGVAVAAYGHDIWVGAPGTTVGTVPGAGAVYHYRLTGTGTAHLIGEYTESTAGVPGIAERDDGFGSVLSMDDAGALAVGEPSEDVGSAQNAGTVTIIRTDATRSDPGTGAFTSAMTISQNSPGVSGAAEVDDDFGSSLSMIETGYPDASLPDVLAVGVPGEGVGTAYRTGGVHVLTLEPGRVNQPAGYHQDTAGVPGGNENGDGFGQSVQFGSFTAGVVDGVRALDLAIGVPYENRGVDRLALGHGFGTHTWSSVPVTAPSGSHTGRYLGTIALPGTQGSSIAVARPWDQHGKGIALNFAGSLVVVDAHTRRSTAFSDSAGPQKYGEYGIPANVVATQTIIVR